MVFNTKFPGTAQSQFGHDRSDHLMEHRGADNNSDKGIYQGGKFCKAWLKGAALLIGIDK